MAVADKWQCFQIFGSGGQIWVCLQRTFFWIEVFRLGRRSSSSHCSAFVQIFSAIVLGGSKCIQAIPTPQLSHTTSEINWVYYSGCFWQNGLGSGPDTVSCPAKRGLRQQCCKRLFFIDTRFDDSMHSTFDATHLFTVLFCWSKKRNRVMSCSITEAKFKVPLV